MFTTLARASPRVAPLPRAGRRLQMPRRTALGSLGEARPADRGVLEPQVPGVGLGEGGCLNRRSLETEPAAHCAVLAPEAGAPPRNPENARAAVPAHPKQAPRTSGVP